MNHIRNDTPDHHIQFIMRDNIGIIRVFRFQLPVIVNAFQAFYGEFAIQGTNNNLTSDGFNGTINHQNIIWMNALNLSMSKKQLKNIVINQTYEMNYADYRLLADRLFSFRRKVKIVGQQDNTYTVDIDYKKVTLNEPQTIAPIKVPKSYEVVK